MKFDALYPVFLTHVKKSKLLTPGKRMLIAVSGGLDSTVLCHLMVRLRERMEWGLVLGHVNYRKRGADSDADEAFVRDLGARHGLKTIVDRDFIPRSPGNFQDQARVYRYRLLREWAEQEGLDAICTAHHRDDQIETILHRLLRGAGARGLGGMQAVVAFNKIALVRPLLPFSKGQLEAYARQGGLAYRDDASNRSPAYLRNRIRSELIPLLRELAPQADVRIEAVGAFFRELAPFLRAEACRFIQEHVHDNEKNDLFSFDRADFMSLALPVRHEVLYELFRTLLPQVFVSRATIEKLNRLVVTNKAAAHYHLGAGLVFEKTAAAVYVRLAPEDNEKKPT